VAAPRVMIPDRVAEAVRDSLKYKFLPAKVVTKAALEARKQADFLVVLVLDVNERALTVLDQTSPLLQDLVKQRRRMVGQHRLFDREDWTEWRKTLVAMLSGLRAFRTAIAAISEKWFDGHGVLFFKQQAELNSHIQMAESSAKLYNAVDRALPSWTAIKLSATPDSVRRQARRLERRLTDLAMAQALAACGEADAARRIMQAHVLDRHGRATSRRPKRGGTT
jgi:hypothetical protein